MHYIADVSRIRLSFPADAYVYCIEVGGKKYIGKGTGKRISAHIQIARSITRNVPPGEDTNVGLSEAEATMLRYRQKAERDRWAKIARRAVRIAAAHVRRHRFSWFRQTALSPTAENILRLSRGEPLTEQVSPPKPKRLRELLQTALLIRTPRTRKPH
jgi:hypothetical protein